MNEMFDQNKIKPPVSKEEDKKNIEELNQDDTAEKILKDTGFNDEEIKEILNPEDEE